jgi:hypothetical protein
VPNGLTATTGFCQLPGPADDKILLFSSRLNLYDGTNSDFFVRRCSLDDSASIFIRTFSAQPPPSSSSSSDLALVLGSECKHAALPMTTANVGMVCKVLVS